MTTEIVQSTTHNTTHPPPIGKLDLVDAITAPPHKSQDTEYARALAHSWGRYMRSQPKGWYRSNIIELRHKEQ